MEATRAGIFSLSRLKSIDSVMLLMASAFMTAGDMAIVIAPIRSSFRQHEVTW